MVLGKEVAIFNWEWGPFWSLEMGRKSPGGTTVVVSALIASSSRKIREK